MLYVDCCYGKFRHRAVCGLLSFSSFSFCLLCGSCVEKGGILLESVLQHCSFNAVWPFKTTLLPEASGHILFLESRIRYCFLESQLPGISYSFRLEYAFFEKWKVMVHLDIFVFNDRGHFCSPLQCLLLDEFGSKIKLI